MKKRLFSKELPYSAHLLKGKTSNEICALNEGLYSYTIYMTQEILDCILFWCTRGTHLIGVLHISSI